MMDKVPQSTSSQGAGHWPRLRWRALIAGNLAATALAAALVPAVTSGTLLSLPLEGRFAVPRDAKIEAFDGLVALAGALARFKAAMPVAARHPHQRPIFVTGPQTDPVLALARQHGIAEACLTFEIASTNTYDDAIHTRRLVSQNREEVNGRWLLVTIGIHMPRAVGVFRHAGFTVVPYPVINSGASNGQHNAWPAFREWVGLPVYWLRGRTGAIWPAAQSAGERAAGGA